MTTVEVSDEEFELLKQCCRAHADIEGYAGLEDLYERVISAAKDECEYYDPDDEGDIVFDDAFFSVAIPDESYNSEPD